MLMDGVKATLALRLLRTTAPLALWREAGRMSPEIKPQNGNKLDLYF